MPLRVRVSDIEALDNASLCLNSVFIPPPPPPRCVCVGLEGGFVSLPPPPPTHAMAATLETNTFEVPTPTRSEGAARRDGTRTRV